VCVFVSAIKMSSKNCKVAGIKQFLNQFSEK
jgi:hypothetical protein